MTLLTTLIPAYKPDHLGDTLESLRRQSLRDFRVVISDDSPGGAITEMIRDGRWRAATGALDLLVVRGPGGARRNHQRLLDVWDGSTPLVHLLMDDDVVYPGFYQAHVQALAGGDYGLSSSARWFSQGDATPAWQAPLPDFVTSSPLHAVPVTAPQLFASVVVPCTNWVGELSNMVWTAKGIAHFPRPPVRGLSFYGMNDISPVLEAAAERPMVFLRDHLGVFRQHGQQTTREIGTHCHRVAMLVWAAAGLHAWAQDCIDDAGALHAIATTVKRCLNLYPETDTVMNEFFALVQRTGGDGLAALHAAFTPWWLALLHGHPNTAPYERDLHAFEEVSA